MTRTAGTSSAPAPLYDGRAIGACAFLLTSPVEYTLNVRERITYSRTETDRHVEMSVSIPDLGSPQLFVDTSELDATSDRVALIPILTPDKGILATTEGYSVNGTPARHLSHAEHAQIEKEMVRHLLFRSLLAWSALDIAAADSCFKDMAPKLEALVDLDPGVAMGQIDLLFRSSGRLTANPFGYSVTADEDRLHRLCRLVVVT